MILSVAGRPHLTYCTNIHPGETWSEVRRNVEQYLLPVKEMISPSAPFGIGLRLSAVAARSLWDREELEAFREFLDQHNLYVFTLNGFPYGAFHRTRVKEEVYRPDWLEEERLAYSDLLATILVELLPKGCDVQGSVSTVPGAFKPRVSSRDQVKDMAMRMVRHAATLHRLHESTGRIVTLALEPEPCCFLETIEEATTFFQVDVFGSEAISLMRRLTGLDKANSEDALRRHLGICLDTCHAAVEFEDPVGAIEALRHGGIKIAKVQLSSGLRIPKVDPITLKALQAFEDRIYLHQVVERQNEHHTRFCDLDEAFASVRTHPHRHGEWRIHFHVPIFLGNMGVFDNTQSFLERILRLQAKTPFTDHLEVETYTWDVLPPEYRETDIVSAIARELKWVIERMTP